MMSRTNPTLLSLLLASLSLAGASSALASKDRHHQYAHSGYSHHERVVVYERHASHDLYAPVLAARPIYRTIAVEVPVNECRTETHSYRERTGGDSFSGTLLGGLAGAAIGYELGHSSGHAAAAGGLIGAALGNNAAGGGRTVTRYEDREVCRPSYRTQYENQLVGYDVSYSHQGRIYYTETRHHPGDRIRLGSDSRGRQ